MAHPWINRELYEAILNFEESEEAQAAYNASLFARRGKDGEE